MDFVLEYSDSDVDRSGTNENGSTPPIPSASLKLPAIPDDITRKFSNLSILKNIAQRNFSSGLGGGSGNDQDKQNNELEKQENSLAFKYAKSSLELLNATSSSGYATFEKKADDITNGSGTPTGSYSALENRLARVLNATNFNASIRESLLILQSRIDHDESSNNSFTNGNVQDPTRTGGLKGIIEGKKSVNYSQLAGTGILGSVARRKLRSEVESDLLTQHYQALKEFQPIVKKLNVVRDDLEDLNAIYDIIQEKLTTQIDENAEFKANADKLSVERDIVIIKKEVLNSFKSSFTLSHYEEHCLRNEDINEEFFTILLKVEKIYNNCDILLSLNNDKLGIEIMNKMTHLMDMAVDRLAAFVKKHLNIYFNSVGKSDMRRSTNGSDSSSDQIDSFQRSLLYILQKRETKFDEVVGEIIQSRSQQVVNDFMIQLNGYNETVRKEQEEKRQQMINDSKKKELFSDPNDLYNKSYNNRPLMDLSYDSKRFLSDLLAYLHGIIANEREIVESLFDISSEKTNSSKDMGFIIDTVVNKVMSSLSRPLKGTFEQALRQESKVLIVQSFFGLLDLYTVMFKKLLVSREGKPEVGETLQNSNSSLIDTLDDMKQLTIQKLFNTIQLKLKSIKADAEIEEITDELNIPDWLIDYYSDFFPIFESMDKTEKEFIGEDKFNELVKLTVDEPLNLLQSIKPKLIAEMDLTNRSFDLLTMNCLDFLSLKLTSIPILTFKLEEVSDQILTLKQKLEKQEFDKLLLNCGLTDMYNLINMIFSLDQDFFDLSIYEPITENKLFCKQTLIEADLKMTSYLPTVLIDQEDADILKLVSPSISSEIVINSSLEFVEFYYKLLLIVDTYLRPQETEGMDYFRWDDIRVATLLGVEEKYLSQKIDYSNSLE